MKPFMLIFALVILSHCVTMVVHLKRERWIGHKAEFAVFAASISSMGSGAAGVALGWEHAAVMLMAGVAGLIIIDRRRHRQ